MQLKEVSLVGQGEGGETAPASSFIVQHYFLYRLCFLICPDLSKCPRALCLLCHETLCTPGWPQIPKCWAKKPVPPLLAINVSLLVFKISLCMCGICACQCGCVHTWSYTHACGSYRLTSSIFFPSVTPLFKKKLIGFYFRFQTSLFYVCECFDSMCVCVPSLCLLALAEVRRGCQIPWN